MNFQKFKDSLKRKKRIQPYNKEMQSFILELSKNKQHLQKLNDLSTAHFLKFALSISTESQSQIFQDAFVLYVLNSKKDGFYCDFGATNGYSLSNSYNLEKNYNWKGICAEPAKNWHDDLTKNRDKAFIEFDCVWSKTGEDLTFSECSSKELSTLTSFTSSDGHSRRRKKFKQYHVKTISLNDLLEKYNAPINFDYLSMDTEGSELEILETFDIKKWQPKVITIEHNYTNNRIAILEKMTHAGYSRVLTDVSSFDDWYLAPGIELPSTSS